MTSSQTPSVVDWDELESVCTLPKCLVPDGQPFAGRVMVITGAGGQFGRAGCLYFCRRGARVAALDLDKEGLKGTFDCLAAELRRGQFDFMPYVCNVTDPEQIGKVMESIVFRFHRIDYLWNNAGYQGRIEPALQYDPEDFARVVNINVTGMFIVMQAAARVMSQQAGHHYSIVNTASVAGLRGTPGMIAYSSSKAAVMAMTITAAKEWAQHGIRVNSISPALIGPGYMWDRQNQLHAEQVGPPFFAETAEQVAAQKIAGVPMKRLGTVDEVLKSVAFLLGSESSYTTGINLTVDGGLAAGLKA